MKKEKLGQAILYFLLANLILLVCVLGIHRGAALVDIGSRTPGASMSLYYAADSTFDENRRTDVRQLGAAGTQVYTLNSVGFRHRPDLRLDFADVEAVYTLSAVTYTASPFLSWTLAGEPLAQAMERCRQNSIVSVEPQGDTVSITTGESDPFVVLSADALVPHLNPAGLALTLLLELLMLTAIWGAVSLTGMEEIPRHKTKQRIWLDLAKFICAYLIVALHVSPLSTVNQTANYYITQGAARLGVPLFFAISGYLFFQKLYHPETGKFEKNNGIMISYCSRILTLYFFWNLVYAFIVPSGGTVVSARSYLWNLLVEGGYWQLWYLLALAIGVAVLYWLVCAGVPLRWLVGLAVVLYLFGMVLDFGYLRLVKTVQPLAVLFGINHVYFPRGAANAAFFALPMLTIGLWFVTHPWKRISLAWPMGLAFALLVVPAEALLVRDRFAEGATNLLLTLPLAVYFLLAALTRGRDLSLLPATARWMRSASTSIYLIHAFFIEWLQLVPYLKAHSLALFVCVCIGSTVSSAILIGLSRPMPLLKKIY